MKQEIKVYIDSVPDNIIKNIAKGNGYFYSSANYEESRKISFFFNTQANGNNIVIENNLVGSKV